MYQAGILLIPYYHHHHGHRMEQRDGDAVFITDERIKQDIAPPAAALATPRQSTCMGKSVLDQHQKPSANCCVILRTVYMFFFFWHVSYRPCVNPS